jgi:hypothetical protein
MTKIDLKSELKHLYKASAKAVAEVDVPEMRYLMVDGKGDPNNSKAYSDAVEALFSISYTAKFMVKRGDPKTDYAVMPLEGLWWADDMTAFVADDKSDWEWTMMILQPSFVADSTIAEAMNQVATKKDLPALQYVRLEAFTEGHCAQILHKGPFADEGPTIERLHEYIDSNGTRTGKHHEVYLSDIRRAKPENWKTIIRQPMRPQNGG